MSSQEPIPDAQPLLPSFSPLQNRTRVLVLQHPQEPGHDLGSAPLLSRSLAHVGNRVGLSWRNLTHALGTQTFGQLGLPAEIKPKLWGVLYLGSGLKCAEGQAAQGPGLYFVSKAGAPVLPPIEGLQGLIVLDGTWSQAKSLWWRNAWLLKCQRLVLVPERPSLYGKLRKEPRRECVSSLEAVAVTLSKLEKNDKIEPALVGYFKEYLSTKKTHPKKAVSSAHASSAKTPHSAP